MRTATRVRPANDGDFDAIMVLSRAFWEQTDYNDPFDEDHARDMMEMSHEHRMLVVLEVNEMIVGFASGFVQPLIGAGTVHQAIEAAFFVHPEYRGHGMDLLKGFERAARLAQVKYLNMFSLQCCRPEVAETVYRRLGYQHIESTWRKEL